MKRAELDTVIGKLVAAKAPSAHDYRIQWVIPLEYGWDAIKQYGHRSGRFRKLSSSKGVAVAIRSGNPKDGYTWNQGVVPLSHITSESPEAWTARKDKEDRLDREARRVHQDKAAATRARGQGLAKSLGIGRYSNSNYLDQIVLTLEEAETLVARLEEKS